MRRNKNRALCFVLILLLLTACSTFQDNQKERPKIDAYFDLAGLIDDQVQNLSITNPHVYKEAVIDGKQEVLEIDSLNWKKELNIFVKADINKARLLGQYRTTTYTDDAGNRVTQYQNIDDNVSGVAKMEIVENPDSEELLSIFVESCEYNTLFASEVELEMNFEEEKNEHRLKAYSIKGFEKVIMKDTMTYSITAKIGT